jgi:ATP-dependent Clp protease adapter protein ClpS
MENEKTVIEPGLFTTDIPKDRDKTDDGNSGEMVSVQLENDSVTLCAYVVFCLLECDFGLTHKEAESTMWQAHCCGDATVGIYPRKVAEQLLLDVAALNARCGQYPRFIIQ